MSHMFIAISCPTQHIEISFTSRPAVVLCVFNRDPRSGLLSSRPHGRVEAVMLIVKTVLSLLFVWRSNTKPFVLVAAVCVSAVISLYLALVYLPFYNHKVNQIYAGCMLVNAWAAFMMAISMVWSSPEVLVCP